MNWNELIGQYVTAMKAAGRSPGTIRLHRHYLGRLAEQHRRTPASVTRRHLETFLSQPSWSPETRKSARGAVRGLFRWAHGVGLHDDDPSAMLPAVRIPRGRARPYPEHLVARLARDDDRIGFMAMLAAYGGLRAAEIAQVHEDHLVGDELLIKGKGGVVRAVPIVHAKLLIRLQRVEGWAFPNGRGHHLTPGHVTRLLSDAMPDGWTAHTLRHRYATVAFAGTRDLLSVGALLGHSRPETTQRYVLLPDDAIRAAARAASA